MMCRARQRCCHCVAFMWPLQQQTPASAAQAHVPGLGLTEGNWESVHVHEGSLHRPACSSSPHSSQIGTRSWHNDSWGSYLPAGGSQLPPLAQLQSLALSAAESRRVGACACRETICHLREGAGAAELATGEIVRSLASVQRDACAPGVLAPMYGDTGLHEAPRVQPRAAGCKARIVGPGTAASRLAGGFSSTLIAGKQQARLQSPGSSSRAMQSQVPGFVQSGNIWVLCAGHRRLRVPSRAPDMRAALALATLGLLACSALAQTNSGDSEQPQSTLNCAAPCLLGFLPALQRLHCAAA